MAKESRAGLQQGLVDLNVTLEDDKVDAMLQRLDHILLPLNLTEFLKSYAEPWFMGRAAQSFNNEVDPQGRAWAPLKPYTVDTREALGFPGEHPINHRTGAMERYIVHGGRTFMVGSAQATMRFPGRGNSLFNKKLQVAQQGANFPKTVARPVIGMNERDLAFLLRGLSTWVAMEMSVGSGGTLGTF